MNLVINRISTYRVNPSTGGAKPSHRVYKNYLMWIWRCCKTKWSTYKAKVKMHALLLLAKIIV